MGIWAQPCHLPFHEILFNQIALRRSHERNPPPRCDSAHTASWRLHEEVSIVTQLERLWMYVNWGDLEAGSSANSDTNGTGTCTDASSTFNFDGLTESKTSSEGLVCIFYLLSTVESGRFIWNSERGQKYWKSIENSVVFFLQTLWCLSAVLRLRKTTNHMGY